MGIDIKALGSLTLPDHEERPVRLSDLWSDRHAVIIFLRHYG